MKLCFRTWALIGEWLAGALLLGCSDNTTGPRAGGGGTETVVGVLVDKSGDPAQDVFVTIRPREFQNLEYPLARTGNFPEGTDTVYTDEEGIFRFDSLEADAYYIEADDGSGNAVLIRFELLVDYEEKDLGEHTLKPAGTLAGTIHLPEGGDPRKVNLILLGIDIETQLDTNGYFIFDSLPEAEYILRIQPLQPDYAATDLAVEVVSGETTDLEILSVPFTGIPTIDDLQIDYNQSLQIVNLTWSIPDTSRILGYNVYRGILGDNLTRITKRPLPSSQPQFSDTLLIEGATYEYRIAAVDSAGNEGKLVNLENDTVTVAPEFEPGLLFDNFDAKLDVVRRMPNGMLVAAGWSGPCGAAVSVFGDCDVSTVAFFDASGALFNFWSITNLPPDSTSQIVDIQTDENNNLYLLTRSSRVHKYNLVGLELENWEVPSNQNSHLAYAEGYLFVTRLDTLYRLSLGGDGAPEKASLGLGSILGITATDSNSVAITSSQGITTLTWNGEPSAPMTLHQGALGGTHPSSLFTGADGLMYVLTDNDLRMVDPQTGAFQGRFHFGDLIPPSYLVGETNTLIYYMDNAAHPARILDITGHPEEGFFALIFSPQRGYSITHYISSGL